MGSGISAPSRRYSSSGIETGSDAVNSQRVSPLNEAIPFECNEDHTSRRLSQLNFSSAKQLEGYGGILTSKTSLVSNEPIIENELEINFQCLKLENDSPPSGASLQNRRYRSMSLHFFKFFEIPVLVKKNLGQSLVSSSASASQPSSSLPVTYHLELDISLIDLHYNVADAILILPENPLEDVEMIAKFFQFDLDDNCSYDFQADFNHFSIPFPAPFTIRQVLTCYLDLMVRLLLPLLTLTLPYPTPPPTPPYLSRVGETKEKCFGGNEEVHHR
jgi:sulfite reductase alpha subunit-like flavoprotein